MDGNTQSLAVVGPFTLDHSSMEIWVTTNPDRKMSFKGKTFSALPTLARRPNQVIAHAELAHLLGDVREESAKAYISNARRLLDLLLKNGCNYIVTVKGLGYKLVQSLEEHPEGTASLRAEPPSFFEPRPAAGQMLQMNLRGVALYGLPGADIGGNGDEELDPGTPPRRMRRRVFVAQETNPRPRSGKALRKWRKVGGRHKAKTGWRSYGRQKRGDAINASLQKGRESRKR